MKIAVVVGTRPTFIDLAPVIHELQQTNCELVVYHTGQHYDKEMSDIFLKQLDIPKPRHNLHAGGGSNARQTAAMLTRCEAAFMGDNPDLLVVEGDTNSAFSSALAAAKIKVPIVHIEAGCRTFDKTLPEEINRVLISHVASLHFAPTQNCKVNLLAEGINYEAVNLVGHPIVDSINIVRDRLRKITYLDGTNVEPHSYYYLTMHRDFNVDDPTRLEYILGELGKIAMKKQIIFSVHPRTRRRIRQFGLEKYLRNMKTTRPLDYVTSLSLAKNAYAIISDSGGLTKEGCLFGVPCITLRRNTEWIETLYGNSNQLAFGKGNTIRSCVERLDKNFDKVKKNLRALRGLFGMIGVSTRIARIICECDPKDLISRSTSAKSIASLRHYRRR